MPARKLREAFPGDVRPELPSAHKIMHSAKIFLMKAVPTIIPAVHGMTITCTNRVPTLAVTKNLNVAYNPEFVQDVYYQATQVSKSNPCKACGAMSHSRYAYIGGIIYHEIMHVLRRHWVREQSLVKREQQHGDAWNIAGDIEINDNALEFFKAIHTHRYSGSTDMLTGFYGSAAHLINTEADVPEIKMACFPEGWTGSHSYNLERGHPAEWYYYRLPKELPSLDHGSAVSMDSILKDLEEQGLSPQEIEEIRTKVAQEMQRAESTLRGNASLLSLLEWAKDNLPVSKNDYKKYLRRTTSKYVSRSCGYDDESYEVPHKTSSVFDYNVIYPSTFQRTPKVLIVLDTSGSMTINNRASFALSEVKAAIRSVRAEVLFFCADYEAGTLQKAKDIRSLKLEGGGGTHMGKAVIEALASCGKQRPNVVILITDGETPWLNKEDMNGVPLIVTTVNETKVTDVPKWATHIHIDLKDEV